MFLSVPFLIFILLPVADSISNFTPIKSLFSFHDKKSPLMRSEYFHNLPILSCRKRFLVFPAKSTLKLSVCLAKSGIILSPPVFVFTFDMDLKFDLPDNTRFLQPIAPVLRVQRSDRREVYDTMENLLDSQGLDGRACVLRALCEAQQMLAPGKDGLMEDLFHAIFSLPQDTRTDEDMDLHEHDTAHRHGRSNQNCEKLYSSCPISLINLALW